jgi:hypothetical protein
MHAHSAGTWQPTQAPTSRTTSMGNAAGHCALIDSTAFTCWANGGPHSNPLLFGRATSLSINATNPLLLSTEEARTLLSLFVYSPAQTSYISTDFY